jgi:hypothetical protein
MPSFGREVKPWVPCRRFAACKRTRNVSWKSAFRKNYRPLFRPISSKFRRWSAERVGRRGGKVGTSKAGGTISQQAAVHPWLAADAHGNKQLQVFGVRPRTYSCNVLLYSHIGRLYPYCVEVTVVTEMHTFLRLR